MGTIICHKQLSAEIPHLLLADDNVTVHENVIEKKKLAWLGLFPTHLR